MVVGLVFIWVAYIRYYVNQNFKKFQTTSMLTGQMGGA